MRKTDSEYMLAMKNECKMQTTFLREMFIKYTDLEYYY